MTPAEQSALDVTFCRHLLSLVHKDVKALRPDINLRKDAWVYCYGRDNWEFHGPGNFYDNFRASNAYDARQKGWSKWLHHMTKDNPELVR